MNLNKKPFDKCWKKAFLSSVLPSAYDSPRITHELRRSGETCSENRVAKLMKQAKLNANIGFNDVT
jgi:hypothetical protein